MAEEEEEEESEPIADARDYGARGIDRKHYLPLMAALQACKDRPKWVRVVVTRAHDTFALPLLYHLAIGGVFGVDQPIELRLLVKKERQGMLRGRLNQMTACAANPLREVLMMTDISVAFRNADAIFMVPYRERICDEVPRMRRRNYVLFRDYGVALKKFAPPKVHVVCLGPHACVYATLCALFCDAVVSERYITAVSRMQEARARGMAAPKLHLAVPTAAGSIRGVIVWGHPVENCLPDLSEATSPAGKVANMIGDSKWMRTALREPIPRELWSRPLVLSGGWALAAACHMRDWWHGTKDDTCVPMCVASDGSYGVPKHMVFAFPVTVTPDREWHICKGLAVDHFTESQVATAVRDQRRHLRLAILTLLNFRGRVLPPTPATPPSTTESSSWIDIEWCRDEEDDRFSMWDAAEYISDEGQQYEVLDWGFEGDQQWDPSQMHKAQGPIDWDEDWSQRPEVAYQWWPSDYTIEGDYGEQPYQEAPAYPDTPAQDWYDQGGNGEWGQGQDQSSQDWRDKVSAEAEKRSSQWGSGARDHWRGEGQEIQGATNPQSQEYQDWNDPYANQNADWQDPGQDPGHDPGQDPGAQQYQ